MALTVIDRAMQSWGGAGVCQDTPLASMYAQGRTMRIVDGPDEVHLLQLGRNENKRGKDLKKKIEWQKQESSRLAAQYGISEERLDPLMLNRLPSKTKSLL